MLTAKGGLFLMTEKDLDEFVKKLKEKEND